MTDNKNSFKASDRYDVVYNNNHEIWDKKDWMPLAHDDLPWPWKEIAVMVLISCILAWGVSKGLFFILEHLNEAQLKILEGIAYAVYMVALISSLIRK